MVPTSQANRGGSKWNKGQSGGWKGDGRSGGRGGKGGRNSLPPGFKNVRDALDHASRQFAEWIRFLPSAFASADESPYARPAEVFHALQVLADVARRMKEEKKQVGPLGKAFEAHGVRFIARISTPTNSKYGKHYKVLYRSRYVSIARHFTLGGGRDPQNCLSIHFYIDERDGGWVPVVAHVGRHLPNVSS